MSHQLQDDDLSIGAELNASTLEEAAHLLFQVWRDYRPEIGLDMCRAQLEATPPLFDALRDAFRSKSYERIRQWTSTSEVVSMDNIVDQDASTFLNHLRPDLAKFVDSPDGTFKTWSPRREPLNQSAREFIAELAMPSIITLPNMLLHELGRFRDDQLLRRRVESIFRSGQNTILVNGSGTGKTRLLFEGLHRQWGFYFTAVVDSSRLGSFDLSRGIDSYIPFDRGFCQNLPQNSSDAYPSLVRKNREIASLAFSRILLARLMIFDLFLEVARQRFEEWDNDIFKYRWLLLQLFPSAVCPSDVFDDLQYTLERASQSYIDERINIALVSIRRAFSASPPSGRASPPFFCALDEAQYAASQHKSAFRQHESLHIPSSVLQEIIHSWEQRFAGHGISLVVSGVKVPRESLSQTQSNQFHWTSNTGAFDDFETQKGYVMKYLPESFAQSASGKRLVERIWYWLQGRHRFTASFLSVVLEYGFKRPHGLLNLYVQNATQFRPTDADDLIREEQSRQGDGPLSMSFSYGLAFYKLQNAKLFDPIYQMAVDYLFRKTVPPNLTKSTLQYVGAGIALFKGPTMSTAVMYEPIIILSALQWPDNHTSIAKLLVSNLSSSSPPLETLENAVVYSIFKLVSQKRPLIQIFSFGTPTPQWARESAMIVGLYHSAPGGIETGIVKLAEAASRLEIGEDAGPSVALGVNVTTPDAMCEWLNHSFHEPFCFSKESGMGPSIIFILKLNDGSLIWVAVEVLPSFTPLCLHEAIRRVTPSQFFMREDLPSTTNAVSNARARLLNLPGRRLKGVGKYSLLRIIATPTEVDLKSYLANDPDRERHPIACFNMQLFNKAGQKRGRTPDEGADEELLPSPKRLRKRRKA